jgi:hypothetical protein
VVPNAVLMLIAWWQVSWQAVRWKGTLLFSNNCISFWLTSPTTHP